MKQVPTTWDENSFIDGYPGHAVVARRHGKQWYAVCQVRNGTKEVLKLKLELPMLAGSRLSNSRTTAGKNCNPS